MIDDAMVEAIIEICNKGKLIKQVEPNLMWHAKIEEWMVRRIFKAVELLQEAYGLQQREQGNNRIHESGGSKGFRKVPEERNSKARARHSAG